MSELDQLADVIGAIYDTTLDPSRWTSALEKTAAFVGGKGSTLASHDTASSTGNFSYFWGSDPEYMKLYYTSLIKINPVAVPINLYYEPGEVFSLTQIMPHDEFRRTRLYREWVEPQGWGDFTHFLVEKSGSRFSHFGVANALEDSPAGEEPRRLLRMLVPHVMRAVAISKAMELRALETNTLSATVDSLGAGVFLVREDQTIVYTNPSAQAMLERSAILFEADGVLRTKFSAAAATLRSAITAAVLSDIQPDPNPFAIPLSGPDGERWVAHVVSLTTGARKQAGKLYGASVAVFVHKAELVRPTLIQAVVKHYALTHGESRVLFAILEAGGVPQTAAALGLGEETVKTHLKHLFRKTGTSRQAELVKLVAEFSNPMVG